MAPSKTRILKLIATEKPYANPDNLFVFSNNEYILLKERNEMDEKKCTICSKPAKMRCEMCAGEDISKDGRVLSYSRWYCGETCEESDADRHQQECQKRQEARTFDEAERAAVIAQSLFNLFVEKTWVYDISNVEFGEDIEVVAGVGAHHGFETEESFCSGIANGLMLKFPPKLLQSKYVTVKNAVLADANATWSLVVTSLAVQLLFEPLVNNVSTDIKEVTHTLRNGVSRTVTYSTSSNGKPPPRTDQPYGEEQESTCFEITLKTGQIMALCLVRSMYKKYEYRFIWHWAEYSQNYVGEILQRDRLGTAFQNHAHLLKGYDNSSLLNVSMALLLDFNRFISNVKDTTGLPRLNEYAGLIVPQNFFNQMGALIRTATDHLDKTCQHVAVGWPVGNSTHPKSSKRTYGPNVVAGASSGIGPPLKNQQQFVYPAFSNLKYFEWKLFKDACADMTGRVKYKRKTELKEIREMRSVYKPNGETQLRFLTSELPPKDIPAEWASINPFWER